ncbi:Uncharacterised protein [Mycobacterium tuberculosis]|nr:Uncharacterised protein [Mycobacterium tuberculosis]
MPPPPAVAVQQPALSAGPAGRTGSAGTTGSAVADQPGRPAAAAGNPRVHPGRAITAIAIQQPARPAVLPGRRPVGTITDQRTSQQCLGGRIDRVQQTLLNVGGLGVGIRPRTRTQGLHELGMKRRRLRADRLIRLGVRAEERRNRRRYVICARGQHAGGRDAGSRVSRADRRTEIGQIRGRRRQELRNGNHKRHWPPPNSFRTNRRQQSLLSQRIGGRGFRLIRPMDLDRYRAAGSGPPALCAPALARSGSAGGLRVPVKVNTASSPGPSPSQLSTSTVTT